MHIKSHKRLTCFIFLVGITFLATSVGITGSLASPEVTISDIRISNVWDVSFTVTWLTNNSTVGEIHYGTSPGSLDMVAYDNRGTSTSARTHFVQIGGLSEQTTYYFDIHSGGMVDDNGGSHYTITTGPTITIPTPDNAYGQVFKSNGSTPAEGCLVFIQAQDGDGMGDSGLGTQLSWYTDSDGWWFTSLANSRIPDLSTLFSYSSSGDNVNIEVECASFGTTSQVVDTADDAPAPSMILEGPDLINIYLPFLEKP